MLCWLFQINKKVDGLWDDKETPLGSFLFLLSHFMWNRREENTYNVAWVSNHSNNFWFPWQSARENKRKYFSDFVNENSRVLPSTSRTWACIVRRRCNKCVEWSKVALETKEIDKINIELKEIANNSVTQSYTLTFKLRLMFQSSVKARAKPQNQFSHQRSIKVLWFFRCKVLINISENPDSFQVEKRVAIQRRRGHFDFSFFGNEKSLFT